MADPWPILIAAGRLRRGESIETVIAATGLRAFEVRAIAERLRIADAARAAGGRR